MKGSPSRFVLSLVIATGVSAAEKEPSDSRLIDAAQDAEGFVWARSASPAFRLAVYYSEEEWRAVSLPDGLRDAEPEAIERGGDGAVFVLWRAAQDRTLLTKSKAFIPRVTGTFTRRFSYPLPLGDSDGNVWLTEGREIYRAAADGTTGLFYTIPEEAFDQPIVAGIQFSPIRKLEDAQKRIWFWSIYQGSSAAMRGAVIFGNNQWRTALFEGIPNNHFTFIEPADAEHLWIQVFGEGLYSLDINTLVAKPIIEPEPGAFRNLCSIVHIGDSDYAVAETEPIAGHQNVLWRLHSGTWKKLTNNLDASWVKLPRYEERPALQMGGKALIGGFGTGAWLVNEAGEVDQVDWRRKFPLRTTDRLFRIGKDRWLALEFCNYSAEGPLGVSTCQPAALLSAPSPPLRASTVGLNQKPVQDTRGHIWFERKDHPEHLAEWNGTDWIFHLKPESIRSTPINALAIDSHQRIWAFNSGVDVYDTRSDRWQRFESIEAAMGAHAGKGMRLEGITGWPQFTDDGRAAFIGYEGRPPDHKGIWYHWQFSKLHYFDGRTWRKWTFSDFAGKEVELQGLWFSKENLLALKTKKDVWQYSEARGWERARSEIPLPETMQLQSRTLPTGAVTQEPDSISSDRFGACWFTWKRQLYKGAFDRYVTVFDDKEGNPFVDGRRIFMGEVFIDPLGNALIPAKDPEECVILRPAKPPPNTNVRLAGVRDETATIGLSSSVSDLAGYVWRCDSERWNALTTDSNLTLTFQENGEHQVEAYAVNNQLQCDPTPQRVRFKIAVDWKQRVARAVKDALSVQGGDREKALKVLVRQPILALPMLKNAREKATDDQRWWIDAAIQEIERQKR